MRFFVVIAAIASIASAANITVKVGENDGLTYDPTNVTAAAGDIIQFEFVAKNHTVTQSTFADPCQKMTTPTEGVDSGFVPVNGTTFPVWSFTVNNASAPLWFYCAQTGHCAKGMVFAINPTANKSFAAFQVIIAAALATASNSTSSSSASGSGTSITTSAGASAATARASASASSSTAANGATTMGHNSVILVAALAIGGVLL
ncbi:Cupredoxin [Guyanagaster necrorhizus]|uniref:Cupredoxin n=1 Tax=Guyanagaster necrorhizus TaxID=856835 RepID=A0A9P7VHY8_9AGAR|nr:Cupredoxin [Guyanagaster necrorhizus MCA 3950]KAG7440890.1 Cupredoxin [Guyanagaster necrorhizus MCA 3950]